MSNNSSPKDGKILKRKDIKGKLESRKKEKRKNAAPLPVKVKKVIKKAVAVSDMSVPKAKRVWFSPRTKGRPSKKLSQELAAAKKVLNSAGVPLKKNVPTKPDVKRGRPKKTKIAKADPKKPRGRPRKHPLVEKPKRPRGRPRKHPVSEKPKRPRGRPRKHPVVADHMKRPRGRPKKLLPNPGDAKKKSE